MRDESSTLFWHFYSFHCNTLIVMTTMVYSQKEEEGFDHQIAKMPPVPSPDTVTKFFQLICMIVSTRDLPFGYWS